MRWRGVTGRVEFSTGWGRGFRGGFGRPNLGGEGRRPSRAWVSGRLSVPARSFPRAAVSGADGGMTTAEYALGVDRERTSSFLLVTALALIECGRVWPGDRAGR